MLLFFLYLLWLVFNGRVSVEILLIGLPVTALVYAFSLRTLDLSFRRDLRLLRKIPALLRFLSVLLKDVLLSALRVMRLILSPRAPEPKLVRFRSSLRTEAGRVLLADAVTLTPGTITAELSGGEFTVHCLDGSRPFDPENSAAAERIRRLEEPASPDAASPKKEADPRG